MMVSQRIPTKAYHAIRRRDTGKYLEPLGNKFAERDHPTAPVRRISTARSHRIRAFDSGLECLIDIERVVAGTRERVDEDDAITGRLIDVLKYGCFAGTILAEGIEMPLRNNTRAMSNRYAMVMRRLDTAREAIKALADIADVTRYADVLLLAGDADLVACKMFDEIKPILIFDFEARRPIGKPW